MQTTRVKIFVAVITLVLLAGCLGGISTPQEPTQPNTSDATTAGPSKGSEWTVTITRVVDGDTVEARFPNGETDTIRLLGVDTPETTLGDVSPDEYEGFEPSTAARDHLYNWGEKADQYATDTLAGEEVRVVVDEEADRRGYFGRLLAYIYVDGENFNKGLLADGYARYYDSQFSQADAFVEAEATARSEQRGLWGFDGAAASGDGDTSDSPTDSDTSDGASGETMANSAISIGEVVADAPGNDNENLNGEYITLEAESGVDISGWTVSDEADNSYTIPSDTVLEAGDTVTIYTGSGTDTDTELYWGSGRAVWNNGGDTVIVEDSTGDVVAELDY